MKRPDQERAQGHLLGLVPRAAAVLSKISQHLPSVPTPSRLAHTTQYVWTRNPRVRKLPEPCLRHPSRPAQDHRPCLTPPPATFSVSQTCRVDRQRYCIPSPPFVTETTRLIETAIHELIGVRQLSNLIISLANGRGLQLPAHHPDIRRRSRAAARPMPWGREIFGESPHMHTWDYCAHVTPKISWDLRHRIWPPAH